MSFTQCITVEHLMHWSDSAHFK